MSTFSTNFASPEQLDYAMQALAQLRDETLLQQVAEYLANAVMNTPYTTGTSLPRDLPKANGRTDSDIAYTSTATYSTKRFLMRPGAPEEGIPPLYETYIALAGAVTSASRRSDDGMGGVTTVVCTGSWSLAASAPRSLSGITVTQVSLVPLLASDGTPLVDSLGNPKTKAVTATLTWRLSLTRKTVFDAALGDREVWSGAFTGWTFSDGLGHTASLSTNQPVDGASGAYVSDLASLFAGNDILSGGAGNDSLDGGSGNDTLSGAGGDDTLTPGSGTNTIDGGASTAGGGDTLVLTGSRSDYQIVRPNAVTVKFTRQSGEAEVHTVTGVEWVTFGAETLSIAAATGNIASPFGDLFESGSSLAGGAGDDTYAISSPDGTVMERRGEGTDLVETTLLEYTLAANVEKLRFVGSGQFAGIGNDLGNTLMGSDDNDWLDGKAGADTLIGGAGDDTYGVDSSGDSVKESADTVVDAVPTSFGTDTIVTSLATYTLPAAVERLEYSGAGKAALTGNALANRLSGGAGDDSLKGMDGDDALLPGAGSNTVDGGNGGDILVLAGARGDYVFARPSSTSWQIVRVVPLGADEDHTIRNIESLQFLGDGSVASLADTARGSIFASAGTPGKDLLSGDAGSDKFLGLAGDDYLTGEAGDDYLDGGAGNDNLNGGDGNDTYVLNSPADVVIEDLDKGTDLVMTSVTLTLTANLENLTLVGSAAINGIGNGLANEMRGNDAANLLDGGAGGGDKLTGGKGNDTYVVDAGDTIDENSTLATEIDLVRSSVDYSLGDTLENLTLTGAASNGIGNALKNTLIGNGGANLLDGLGNVDTLSGGKGNDTYHVDLLATGTGAAARAALQDAVTEAADGDSDTLVLRGTVNLTVATTLILANTLEDFDASATEYSLLHLTGNAVANTLIGNRAGNLLDGKGGADIMRGGGGNDSYLLDLAGDVVIENPDEGTDLVKIGIATATVGAKYILGSNIENALLANSLAFSLIGNALDNTLTGNAAVNTLEGGDGNDFLDGGAGDDILKGGSGNDSYVVGSLKDKVEESAEGGIDEIQAFIGYDLSLAANIENLRLVGTAAINGIGNDSANRLTGNAAANTLTGGGGDDSLDGGAGGDKLIGGAGNDSYTASIGDLVAEGSLSAGGTDVLQLSLAQSQAAGLSDAVRRAFDSFSQDLKFSRAGGALQMDFAIDGGASRGRVTLAGMDNVATMVEILRLFDVNGAQLGGDIDLASVWAAAGATPARQALSADGSNFGLLAAAG